MALTADQEAMVQLLLERGQSYADLAGLLGIDEAEVRTRARAALTELGGADPDRNVGLTDWLLGQADPIGRADAVRHLKENPDDHRLAADLLEKLGEIAPQAELPRLPGEPRGGRFLRKGAPVTETADEPPTPAATSPGGERSTGLTASQTRLVAILGSAAIILILVVLAIAGVFSGGSDESSATTTNAGTTSSTTTGTGGDQAIARVPLQPVDNGDAAGLATVGISGGTTPYLDLQMRNLEAAPNGQTYIVWFLFSPTKGYPLAPLQNVAQDGSYDNRIDIPPPVISLVSRAQYIEVSLAPNQTVAAAIQKASKDKTLVIDVPGQAIARGTVPKAAAAPSTGSGSGTG
jgi:hypothetical protein